MGTTCGKLPFWLISAMVHAILRMKKRRDIRKCIRLCVSARSKQGKFSVWNLLEIQRGVKRSGAFRRGWHIPTNIERKLNIAAGSLVGERLASSPDHCGKISDTVVHDDKDDCKAGPLVEWRMASLPNQFRKQKKYVLIVLRIFWRLHKYNYI